MAKKFLWILISFPFLGFTVSEFTTSGLDGGKADEEAIAKAAEKRQKFETIIRQLYDEIGLKEAGLDLEPFRYAVIGYLNLRSKGELGNTQIISIIDFNKSCNEKRFYCVSLTQKKLLYNSLVAHGKNSGDEFPESFSNNINSNKSSLGLYLTGETYIGKKGYSLKLDGLDEGLNDNARERGIVIHKATYVNDKLAEGGNIGKSLGCPALPVEICRDVIEDIKEGSMIFAFHKDDDFINNSKNLNLATAVQYLVTE